MLRTSINKIKENGFELTKKRNRRYPAKTITDIVWNELPQALAFMSMRTKWNICAIIKQEISTLNGSSLKQVDKFTYRGSSVFSTETDIDSRLAKAWTDIHRLSVIWKSYLTDKMKRGFFQAAAMSILLYGCTTWTLTKRLEKKA